MFYVPTYSLFFRKFHAHLKENVYSAALEWNFLYKSITSIWSNVSHKASVSLLTFFLDDLFIDVSGVLKFPTITGLLSVSPPRSANKCFIYFGAPRLGAYILITVMSPWWIIPLSLYTVHYCLMLTFLAWSLFCLMWVCLYPLSFGCHLLGVSSSILSLWAHVCL